MSLQVQVMVCHVITVQHDVGAVLSLVLLLYGLRYLSPTLQCTLLSPNISQPQFNRDLGNHVHLSIVQSRPRLSHSPEHSWTKLKVDLFCIITIGNGDLIATLLCINKWRILFFVLTMFNEETYLSSISPSIHFSLIVKSRLNPFLDRTSTKQYG